MVFSTESEMCFRFLHRTPFLDRPKIILGLREKYDVSSDTKTPILMGREKAILSFRSPTF